MAAALLACCLTQGSALPGWLRTSHAIAQSPPPPATPPPATPPPATPPEARHAVIPAGQEEALATILGRGVDLSGCTFAGAGADATVIRSTYTCPNGAVVFELRHPSAAATGAITTAAFALTLTSGKPPKGLADALASTIRAHEAAFTWQWIGASPTP